MNNLLLMIRIKTENQQEPHSALAYTVENNVSDAFGSHANGQHHKKGSSGFESSSIDFNRLCIYLESLRTKLTKEQKGPVDPF